MSNSVDFFKSLDAMISNSSKRNTSLNQKVTKSAKEELDSTSTVDDFIEAISQAAAEFIRTNRQAFNTDDNEAISEFIDVFSVEKVREQILSYLQTPEEPEEEEQPKEESNELAQDEVPEDTEESAPASKQNQNDDLVSDDVMKLLEE